MTLGAHSLSLLLAQTDLSLVPLWSQSTGFLLIMTRTRIALKARGYQPTAGRLQGNHPQLTTNCWQFGRTFVVV